MKAPSRIVLMMGTAVAVLLVGYWGGQQLFVRALAQTDLSVRPYIAEDTQFYVKDGKGIVTAKEVTVRRRDGAFRKTWTFYSPAGIPGITISRIEFPDGYVAMVADAIFGKSTGKKPGVDVAAAKSSLLNPPPQCTYNAPQAGLSETVDGEDSLFGFRAIRVIRALPKNQRYVSWRLPDFQCVVVQSSDQMFDTATNSWVVTQGKRLTAFASVDPDARIFTNWNTYSEMSPSELKRAVYKQSGVTADECPKCFAPDTESDANYKKWNAQ